MGTIEKTGGRAGGRATSGSHSSLIALLARALFRSFPLTESLEQGILGRYRPYRSVLFEIVVCIFITAESAADENYSRSKHLSLNDSQSQLVTNDMVSNPGRVVARREGNCYRVNMPER